MPCRDYESDNWSGVSTAEHERLKKQADRLARIACKAMTELERQGTEDFLVLNDDEVREWWSAHKEADRKAAAAKEATERKAAAAKAAAARLKKLQDDAQRKLLEALSPEEMRALGIHKVLARVPK